MHRRGHQHARLRYCVQRLANVRRIERLVAGINPDARHLVNFVTAPQIFLPVGPGEIDAAIIDMGMPEVDGVWLAKLIRQSERWRNLPLLLLTSIGSADVKPRSSAHIAIKC